MALADARAICPDLATRPADLAVRRRRWRPAPMGQPLCPHGATDGADGLMADISGVPHLFGGEADLREDLHARLTGQGLHPKAPLPEPAARPMRWRVTAAASCRWATDRGYRSALPVTALRMDQDTAEALARVGLHASPI
jgi:protein ImuB